MNNDAIVIFEALSPGVRAPERATEGSAGYDLRAYLMDRLIQVAIGEQREERPTRPGAGGIVLRPEERVLVPLGFRARLPSGFEAQVRIRSSVAFRKGLLIPNAPGTIDADYPDEWLVMLKNAGDGPVVIEHGERIAQVVFARYQVVEWSAGTVALSTSRRGGLGSTE
ncbi:MAG: dUTP diphosphatase [Gemmatimonadaceae bacterium]